jgi:hypothetical protein
MSQTKMYETKMSETPLSKNTKRSKTSFGYDGFEHSYFGHLCVRTFRLSAISFFICLFRCFAFFKIFALGENQVLKQLTTHWEQKQGIE